jgi:hypothetical protein
MVGEFSPGTLKTKYPHQARRVSNHVYMWKSIDSASVSMILQLNVELLKRRCGIVFHISHAGPHGHTQMQNLDSILHLEGPVGSMC